MGWGGEKIQDKARHGKSTHKTRSSSLRIASDVCASCVRPKKEIVLVTFSVPSTRGAKWLSRQIRT